MDEGTKKWYKSKVIWVNAITILASYLQSKYGYAMDGATQGMLLGLVNIILRAVTHEEISW